MAITKEAGRQWPLVAVCTFTGGTEVDAVASSPFEAIDLPAGAIVTGGSFYTPAGFTGNGEIAIHIGSSVLIAAADYDAEANVAFDMVTIDALGGALAANDTVDVVLTIAALSDGTGRLIVEYVIEDRANEVNP